MLKFLRARIVLCAAALAATPIAHASPPRDVVAVPLRASERNAGNAGTAILVPQAEDTVITVIVGVPLWVARPVRLYTFVHRGTCARRDPAPELSLNEVIAPERTTAFSGRGPYTMRKRVPMPIAALLGNERVLVLRSSPADGDVELYCGEISAPPGTLREP